MPELTVRDTLVQVRELLSDPRRWIQGWDAKNAEGMGEFPDDAHAVCWCLDGALGKVTVTADGCFTGRNYDKARGVLGDILQARFGDRSVITFNDTHKHEEVLSLLDEAIESCS